MKLKEKLAKEWLQGDQSAELWNLHLEYTEKCMQGAFISGFETAREMAKRAMTDCIGYNSGDVLLTLGEEEIK